MSFNFNRKHNNLYTHSSGAEIYFDKQDKESEFFISLGFKTVPDSDNGAAHILEHCILNKSKKYDTPNLFLELKKRSASYFLNATTYSNKTIYYANTTIYKDLLNIINVLGNAVFYPDLNESIFMQESCYYTDPNTPHVSGVVFNETLGYYSNRDLLGLKKGVQSLFPTHNYFYDAGGDPEQISSINLDTIKVFHKRFYTPANLKIFISGNVNREEILNIFDNFFSEVNNSEEYLYNEFLLTGKRRLYSYSFQSLDTNISMFQNWILGKKSNKTDYLLWNYIDFILMKDKNALLKDKLLEHKLLISTVPSLDSDLLYFTYTIGFHNISDENSISDILDNLYTALDECLSSDNFHEINRDYLRRYRYTLNKSGILSNSLHLSKIYSGWFYFNDPEFFKVTSEEKITFLKRLEDSTYIKEIIRKSFKENLNQTTVQLIPDSKHTEKIKTKILNNKIKMYHPEESNKIIESDIPMLSINDIPNFREHLTTPTYSVGNMDYWLTNCDPELFLLNISLPLNTLSKDDYLNLPLLSSLMEEQFKELIPELCNITITLESYPLTYKESSVNLFIQLETLMCYNTSIITKLGTILKSFPDYISLKQTERMLHEKNSSLQNHLLLNGMRYSIRRAMAIINNSSLIDEYFYGVEQLNYKNSLKVDTPFIIKLKELYNRLFSSDRVKISVNSNKTDSLIDDLQEQLLHLNINPHSTSVKNSDLNEKTTINYPLNFTALAVKSDYYGTKQHASEYVLANILTNGELWQKVRVQGGAYGAQAMAMGKEGTFVLASHMDPNTSRTFDIYHEILSNKKLRNFSLEEIHKNIIGSIGKELKPVDLNSRLKQLIRYDLLHLNNSKRESHRELVKSITVKDINNALINLERELPSSSRSVIGK